MEADTMYVVEGRVVFLADVGEVEVPEEHLLIECCEEIAVAEDEGAGHSEV
jgi:hypothetical protein